MNPARPRSVLAPTCGPCAYAARYGWWGPPLEAELGRANKVRSDERPPPSRRRAASNAGRNGDGDGPDDEPPVCMAGAA